MTDAHFVFREQGDLFVQWMHHVGGDQTLSQQAQFVEVANGSQSTLFEDLFVLGFGFGQVDQDGAVEAIGQGLALLEMLG